MRQRLICPQGHQWDVLVDGDAATAGLDVACPVCGQACDQRAAARTATDPLAATLAGPPPPGNEQATLPSAIPDVPEPIPTGFEQIAGYEVLGLLGRGGMGVVFKARHTKLNRIVALKMILAGAHADAHALARFRSEAEAIAHLQHPNIVQIYEVGEHEGLPFFSLEFLEGGSLDEKIAGTPQHPRDAAQLVELLARAMDIAHRRGIVHRDLKPANVLLAPGDEHGVRVGADAQNMAYYVPKISDFGVAKRLDADLGQTHTGTVLGTPSYMAPEQARATPGTTGPVVDVYALGAILYELLTGRPPFKGTTSLETMFQAAHDDPVPPTELQPRVPRDLEIICLKCLEKDPRKRYPTAFNLAEDLRCFQEGKPIAARPTPAWELVWKWARRRPALATLAAAGLLLLCGLVGVAMWSNRVLREAADQEAARADEAMRAKADAQAALDDSRRRQVMLIVASGARSLDTGEWLLALPWFAEALVLDRDNAVREPMDRQRLAAVWQLCPRPALLGFHARQVNHAAFSRDGRWLVTASEDHTAQLWDTAGQTYHTLEHGDNVLRAALSPDGQLAATACYDGTAHLWQTATGKEQAALTGHRQPVEDIAFSPDGRRVITAGYDGTARIWEAATGRPLGLVATQRQVTTACFSPDGRRLLTASVDRTARLWDAATLRPQGAPLDHAGPVVHAAFSPDGRRVVTASLDNTARVWDAITGRPITSALVHRAGVDFASFSPDGRLVVTACHDHLARVWDAEEGRLLGPALKHGSVIHSAVFSPDGRRVLTASDDNTARVWDWHTAEPAGPPLKHNGGVQYAEFAPDGRRLVTASEDGTVRVWDMAAAQLRSPFLKHGERVAGAVFSPDGRLVATAGEDGAARVWDAATGRPLYRHLPHPTALVRVLFSPDGRWLLTADQEGTVRFWDVATGTAGRALSHGPEIQDMAFGPDSRRVATAGVDGMVRVWDVATGQVVFSLPHEGPVNRVAFSPDGNRLVTASDDHTARVWDAATGKPAGPPLRHDDKVRDATFNPDGSRVLTASDDRTAQVWDAATGHKCPCTARHGSKVFSAVFDPEGKRVLTASDDNTARIWEAETGEPLTPPLEHHGTVFRALFSADGKRVATAGEDGAARVWDAATGEPLTPPLRHLGPVESAVFSPDGRRLLTSSWWAGRLWPLPSDDRPAEDWVKLAQIAIHGRIDARGGLVPLEAAAVSELWRDLRQRYPGEFTASPEDVRAWHRREAEECLAVEDWFGAAWHLERLADEPSLWRARGRSLAHLGRWAEAGAEWAKGVGQEVTAGRARNP